MIPDVDYYRSSELIHDLNSHFNPPGLTNFIGVVQVDNDLTGIRGLNFPPFSTSINRTCGLYLDGVYFPSKNIPVTFQWRPDKIIRKTTVDGVEYRTDTMLVPNKNALMMKISALNRSGVDVKKQLKLQLNGGVTNNTADWANWIPPMEGDNLQSIDNSRNLIIYSSQKGDAHLLQGISGGVENINRFGIVKLFEIPAGEKREFYFFAILDDSVQKAQQLFDELNKDKESLLDYNENNWNQEIKSIFDKDDSNYSGCLPVLITENKSLEKLYHMGIMGVVYFRRDNPISCMGRTYDTLMPRYWQTVTFIWDYYLSGMVHAMLDPTVMKKYLEKWMSMDIHTCFGLEYISGKSVGPWYAINDHAMVMMIKQYLQWTGNYKWLNSKADNEKTVMQFLHDYVYQYKTFLSSNGLADYGGIFNLLECVSTYVHEVASLNAANIANLQYAEKLYKMVGNDKQSAFASNAANEIFNNLNDLYLDGKGYWNARQPDGTCVEVRHAYDFFTVMNTVGHLLPDKQKQEMVSFFINELKTDKWMRALSESDNDAMFSLRPDHQWNGAYPAWPSQALLALIHAGEHDVALNWVEGLAETANQGPFGQAHFSETIMSMDAGGARKSSPEQPWICDWTCSSNGNWVDVVLRGFAGINPSINGQLNANPIIKDLELYGISHHDRMYDLTKDGLNRKSK